MPAKQHKKVCKQRMAEIRDDLLFTQPDGCHLGECPICCLPLSLDYEKSSLYSCCSKIICYGCVHANSKTVGGDRCPFCREPLANDEECNRRLMTRVKAKDPVAMRHMGTKLYHEGDWDSAFEYWTNAAELGDVDAHYEVAVMYRLGVYGVAKDAEKAVYHLEKAAIKGHPKARNNLACVEGENGNIERAVKHFIIAANPT